jgi:hypothetical protein
VTESKTAFFNAQELEFLLAISTIEISRPKKPAVRKSYARESIGRIGDVMLRLGITEGKQKTKSDDGHDERSGQSAEDPQQNFQPVAPNTRRPQHQRDHNENRDRTGQPPCYFTPEVNNPATH